MSTSFYTFSELRNTADFSPVQVPQDLTIPGITKVRMHPPILHFVFMPPVFGHSICTHSSIRRWWRPLEWGHAIVMLTTVGFTFISKPVLPKKLNTCLELTCNKQVEQVLKHSISAIAGLSRMCVLLPALFSHCIMISCTEVEWTLVQHKCHHSPRLSCITITLHTLACLYWYLRTFQRNRHCRQIQWNNSSRSIWSQKYGINFTLHKEHPLYIATCFTHEHVGLVGIV